MKMAVPPGGHKLGPVLVDGYKERISKMTVGNISCFYICVTFQKWRFPINRVEGVLRFGMSPSPLAMGCDGIPHGVQEISRVPQVSHINQPCKRDVALPRITNKSTAHSNAQCKR